jgi:hypothetical protein
MDRKMTRQPVGQISSALAGSGALIARTGKSVLFFGVEIEFCSSSF